MTSKIIMEKDINDVFDDLALCEESLVKEGYDKGFETGASEGNVDGFHLGYHRGAELGAELGYYMGVITAFLSYSNNTAALKEKQIENLDKLKSMISTFPDTNDENFDILGTVEAIRALYKKVCAQLKIDCSYPYTDQLSF